MSAFLSASETIIRIAGYYALIHPIIRPVTPLVALEKCTSLDLSDFFTNVAAHGMLQIAILQIRDPFVFNFDKGK